MVCSSHLILNFVLKTFLRLNINSAAEIESRLIECWFEIDTTTLVYDSKYIANELYVLNFNVQTSTQERQPTRQEHDQQIWHSTHAALGLSPLFLKKYSKRNQ
jgi:hypothetical protein